MIAILNPNSDLVNDFLRRNGFAPIGLMHASKYLGLFDKIDHRLVALIIYTINEWESTLLKKHIVSIQTILGEEKKYISYLLKEFVHLQYEQQTNIVTVRTNAANMQLIHSFEEHHFKCMDALLILSNNVAESRQQQDAILDTSIHIRLCQREEVDAIAEIAKAAFYTSRFYNDPSLEKTNVDRLYAEWARNNANGRADWNYVAVENGQIVGFLQAIEKLDQLVIDLIAVKSNTYGRGIGSKLVEQALVIAHERKIREVTVGTQVHNYSALRLYQRSGFFMKESYLSFHKWL